MSAKRANRHGRPYLKAPQPLTINVDAKTRYVKNGAAAERTDPASLPALTARLVVDKGLQAPS
jgi:hypothetical protein